MKKILNELFEYKSLSRSSAREVLTNLTEGHYNDSQVAAFLTVYLMRSITVDELMGFRDAMLELCLPLELSQFDPIDLCGTGGDGKDTFNISTLASFIVAGAGQPVAKHGNNGVSSACGSSNLLAHFGYEFTNDKAQLLQSMEQSNICFLHAPLFHPAMKNVAPIRQALGVKTFFNMLGPMVNPAFPKKQLVGVFSQELARLYGYLYQQNDASFAVVHALDGYDEISLTGAFKLITHEGEQLLQPEDIGFKIIQPTDIAGGNSVESSAKIFLDILEGNGSSAQKSVVLANAGVALKTAGKAGSLQEGVALAQASLESGQAYKAFKTLLTGTNKTVVSKQL